jgi:hypothetical protein
MFYKINLNGVDTNLTNFDYMALTLKIDDSKLPLILIL